jgi:sortase (surface protein transpeptidase)
MNVHRAALGAWIAAIALVAVACGGGTDRSAAGVDEAPAAVLAEDHDTTDTETDTDGDGEAGADDDADAGAGAGAGAELSVTEATLAAMVAMDPDRLAALHQHDDHDGHDAASAGSREGLNSVEPARIVIPTIGVDTRIDRAGIDDEGEMEVPDFGATAWFTPSVKPGRVGPSVITGHVDSKQGPDVFFDLKDLDTGDQIEVHDPDGDTVVFTVTGVEQHPKNDYPRERVHGATDGPELRLITCGGIFDRSIGHYDDNIIVYAHRLST